MLIVNFAGEIFLLPRDNDSMIWAVNSHLYLIRGWKSGACIILIRALNIYSFAVESLKNPSHCLINVLLYKVQIHVNLRVVFAEEKYLFVEISFTRQCFSHYYRNVKSIGWEPWRYLLLSKRVKLDEDF